MRPNVRAFVAAACETFVLDGPVYEFGALQVPGQEKLADMRSLLPNRRYIGCDMRSGPGVDRVEDLAALRLGSGVAATILCLDTLEHVFEARRAVDEMIRVLAPGGVLIVAAPFDFRLHLYPDDYWRLSPSCLERLMSPLSATVVGSQGVESSPHTVYGLGIQAPVPSDFARRANALCALFQQRMQTVKRQQTWQQRLKLAAGRLFRGKGEHRRLRDYHETRFSVHYRSGAVQAATSDHQRRVDRSSRSDSIS